ncbi:MAG: hypothetical protein QXP38_13880 [Nitrososphaerota archaeon]
MKPASYLEEILNIYWRLIRIDISESLVEATRTVGVSLPEYERLGIFVNQSTPLILFTIYVFCIAISNRKHSWKRLLFNLILMLLYYMLLILKISHDLYVVNIGLRASQYMLLIFSVMIVKSIEDLWIHNDVKGNGAGEAGISSILLMVPIIMSIVTYPSLLSPSLKGLAPSYYIPYISAKDINPLLPNHTLNICVAVESIGMPESDLFRGFIYGFLPDRINLALSRICKTPDVRRPNNVNCDIIFFTNELEPREGIRIFDAELFTLHVPFG